MLLNLQLFPSFTTMCKGKQQKSWKNQSGARFSSGTLLMMLVHQGPMLHAPCSRAKDGWRRHGFFLKENYKLHSKQEVSIQKLMPKKLESKKPTVFQGHGTAMWGADWMETSASWLRTKWGAPFHGKTSWQKVTWYRSCTKWVPWTYIDLSIEQNIPIYV